MRPTSKNTSDKTSPQEPVDPQKDQQSGVADIISEKNQTSSGETLAAATPAAQPPESQNAPSPDEGQAAITKMAKSSTKKIEKSVENPAEKLSEKASAPSSKPHTPSSSLPPPSPAAPAVAAHSAAAVKQGGGFSWLGVLAIVALLLAAGASVCAVMVWQRMGQMELQLQLSQQNSSSAAEAAKVLAQQSLDMSNSVSGKLAHASTQLDALNEQNSRIDTLVQYINNAKTETMSTDLRAALQSAQLQTQLTGSVEPLLIALKTLDERLLHDNQSAQSPLRQAITQDMENIRNAAVPDALLISEQINDLLRRVDAMPLMIDPPPADMVTSGPLHVMDDPFATQAQSVAAAEQITEQAAEQTAENAAPSEEAQATPAAQQPGFWQRSWQWTTEKSTQVGSAVWGELNILIVVTPISNPEAILLTPEQGAILRENVKLQLLNLRMSVLQRQFTLAKTELQDLQGVIQRYYNTDSKSVQDILSRLQSLEAQMQNVPLPKPEATLGLLATMDNRH